MLVSETIPNLIQGVSQQPDALRLPTQVELSENCYPSAVEGLGPRNPTEHVAKLFAGSSGSAFVYRINRDSAERYIVVIQNGSLRVWTVDGVEKTVATPDGVGYITDADPKAAFWAVTVADYTFILNRKKVAAMKADLTPNRGNEGLVFVKKGEYGSDYKIFVDGVEKATYTTSTTDVSTLKTDAIAADLKADLATNLGAGWTVTSSGSVIHVKKNDGSDFKLLVQDSQGGASLAAFKGTTNKFSGLPTRAPDGFQIAVQPDPDSDAFKYYVKFQVNNAGATFDEGTWIETVKQGIKYQIDPATMPHVLVRESDGSFTFKRATWEDRIVGDEDSASEPSFIGLTINDIFLYKNRLSLLADENTVMSEVGFYFNFWPTTVTSLQDSDPIDTAVVHTKVSILKHAIPFDRKVLLFSDQTQFTLEGGQILSQKTIQIDQTTEFESDLVTKPVAIGRTVYFVTKKGDYNGIREYFVSDDTTSATDAVDVSSHVPVYIPAGVFQMSASTIEDVLVLATDGEPSKLYGYKFHWERDQKVQSAWFSWDLGAGSSVLGIGFIETTLYIVIQRSDGVYLEKLSVAPGKVDNYHTYTTLLDRRITNLGCPYVVNNANDGRTYWTLPYAIDGTMVVTTRQVDPPLSEPPGHLISTTNHPGESLLWGNANWSQSGLVNFDGTKVNDGNLSLDAFNLDLSGVGSYLSLDVGGTWKAMQSVKITASGTYTGTFDIQYSDNGVDWTTVVSGWNAGAAAISERTWAYAGVHKYWRLYKTNAAASGGTIREVQFSVLPNLSAVDNSGSLVSQPVWIGQRYLQKFRFSKFFIREQTKSGGLSINPSGRLQLRTLALEYAKSGYFNVLVTPRHRDTSTYVFTGRIVGDGSNVLGQVALPSGTFSVPILTRNTDATIEVQSDGYLPWRIMSATWEGFYTTRNRRI